METMKTIFKGHVGYRQDNYFKEVTNSKEQPISHPKRNEGSFSKEVAVLKREVACKDYEINVLKSKFEKVKHEKEGIEYKIEKFDKALKDLDKLLGSQITYKSKKGLGYNDVPPPHPLIYNRPKKLDLTYYGLDEFKDLEFKSYSKSLTLTHPNAQRNMVPRAVLMKIGLKPFNTARTVNTAHPKSIVFSAKPMSHFSKTAQSTVRRPFQSKTVLSNKRFTQKVNTAKAQAINTVWPKAVNTARPKAVKTARPNCAVVNAVRGKPLMADKGFVDSGCSRHMTENITYLLYFKEFDGGYVTFGGGAHGAKRRNRTLIEAARTMLADSKLPTTFWAEAVSTACYASRLQKCEVSLLDILEVVKHIGYNTRTEGTITNESAGAQGEINAATSTQKEEISQDCIMMPIWKNAFILGSPSKDVVNTAGQHVNTASPEVNTGRFKLNTVDPSVNTASSSDPDSPKDMFTMGASHTLKVTHFLSFFSDEDEPEVDLGNILNSYTVPTTPNTRIHKDHPIQ
ncbi:hypothetical protein Tco_0331682 [Tanacetum coccineum]